MFLESGAPDAIWQKVTVFQRLFLSLDGYKKASKEHESNVALKYLTPILNLDVERFAFLSPSDFGIYNDKRG